MAERDSVEPPTGPTPPLSDPGPDLAGAEALFAVPFPAPDRTRPRIVSYWLLLIVLSATAVLIRELPYRGDPFLHSLLEAVASVFALLVGGLALMRYYARPERVFLYLGTGYVGTAILTALHALVTGPLAPSHMGDAFAGIDEGSWWVAQLYLAIFVLAAFFTSRGDEPSHVREDVSVYTAGFVGVAALGVLGLGLPRAPGVLVELGAYRPFEFLPALGFALALLGFLRREAWRWERFHHWLVVGLWIQLTLHAGFMAFSGLPFDPLFDAAHFLKVVANVALLHGLLLSLYARLRLGGEAFAAERILAESRRQLQDFLDNALDLFQSTAPNGRILYVNRAWKERLGYTDEQLENLDLFSIVHSESQTTFKRNFQRVLAGEALRNVEVEFVGADGQVVLCSGNMNCRFEDGRPVATRSIFRDITQQRLAERELEASRANLTALVENTGDSIWSVDKSLRLITFNSAFALAVEARTGREPQVGAPLEAIFRIDEVEQYRELFQRALAGARFSQVRVEVIDGQTRHFELFFNPILGDRGVRGVVVFGKDVTPRHRAEEALLMAKEEAEAANKAKSQFLASMSHELRTPLNSVIGFANVLRKNRHENLSDKDLEFMDRILSNGKHLLTLINDVLDLAKVEAGRMEVELTPVDLSTLVRETLQQLEGQVRGREVRLLGDVPEDLGPLRTDPRRLKQVVINLVGNALKFTEKGEVVVRVTADPQSRLPTSLAVIDSGIGIPEERLQAIFEAFQQAEAGTARRYGGTGLGLTISKSICTLLGYDLIVESQVRKGSTFAVRFSKSPSPGKEPSGTAAGADSPSVAGPPARPPKKLALVIDPDQDSRARLGGYLEDFGCRVLTAEDGPAGLELARREHPDLITVDLMMPGMTGWEFLREAKADVGIQDIPVVVVSVAADGEMGRTLGAMDLLAKPVRRDDFVRVLWRTLPRAGRRVLVVDDDPETCAMIEGLLRSTELEVLSVSNGREAVEVLGDFQPDLVLLDLLMPEMDGMTFLDKVRSDPETFSLPVVVLTGKELTRDEVEALSRTTAGVLAKNDNLTGKLEGVVAELLEVRPVAL